VPNDTVDVGPGLFHLDAPPGVGTGRLGVCRFTIGDATIPGYFLLVNGHVNGNCTASLGGSKRTTLGFAQYEILAGSGLFWKHVDGTPGGIVGGTEHNGAQTNGICRIQHIGSGTGEFYVGKDWQGKCFFAEEEDTQEHLSNGNDYEVLKK
jgi:hypothetical protein